MRRRSILLHGLRLVLTIPGALLWTYALNLLLAFVFSLNFHSQLSSILDRSLAAERLNSAFDLGTLETVLHRISYNAPDPGSAYLGQPLYLLCFFILVPGTLFCYHAQAPSHLRILASSGISFFWRFVRITVLAAFVSLAILAPLFFLQTAWTEHVDNTQVGRAAFLQELPGWILIFLVAALLRLYFDLVEVYTIQLADQYRPSGKPDRRVRRTLLPALRTLRQNFTRAYATFLILTLLGFAAVIFTGRIAMHMLAQPRVWPVFLLAQAGLFCMMLTRFWQRGAETILAADNPLLSPPYYTDPTIPIPTIPYTPDPQPNPEPAAPSLPEPDPGVFHHETSRNEET